MKTKQPKPGICLARAPFWSGFGTMPRNHRWRYSASWNGNSLKVLPFWTGTTGIARAGWRCYDCGQMAWDDTDEVFALRFGLRTGRIRLRYRIPMGREVIKP